MQGGQTLGQGLGQAGAQLESQRTAQAEANRPVNPLQQAMIDAMLKYTQRIGKGEDPAQVTAEAKQDPVIIQYQQSQRGGGLAAPAANQPPQAPQSAPQRPSYPDVGAPGGQPQMGAPGQFDPTRQPATGLSMTPGQSLGAPPQGPVSGALDMTPQQAPFARLSAAPVPTQSLGGRSQEFGRQPAPSMGQAPAPRPAPQAQAPYQYNQRDFAQMQPQFGQIMAMQGRQEVADAQAQARRDVQMSRDNTNTFIAILKQRGLDSDRALKEAIEFSKLDVSQQQNVLNNATKVQTANIGANATLGAAGIEAGSRERVAALSEAGKATKTGEDSAEKELRTLINAQANIASKPEWTKDADSVATFKNYQKRIAELQNALGRPVGGTGPRPTASPAPTFSPQAPAPRPASVSRPPQAQLTERQAIGLAAAKDILKDPRANAAQKAKAQAVIKALEGR